MAGFNGLMLTKQGLALQLRVQAGQTKLEFTRIAIGDGILQQGYNIEDLTALLNEKLSLQIGKIEVVSPEHVKVKTSFNNFNFPQGMYVRELGLFAKAEGGTEILYSIGNSGGKADYIPASGDDVVEENLSIITTVGNAQKVINKIDESLIFVTKKEVLIDIATHNEDIEAHPDMREQIKKLNEVGTTVADVEIQGRTLVNLLGRAGNAIYQQDDRVFKHDGSTFEFDRDEFVFRVTTEKTTEFLIGGLNEIPMAKGKYYLLIADLKVNNGTPVIAIGSAISKKAYTNYPNVNEWGISYSVGYSDVDVTPNADLVIKTDTPISNTELRVKDVRVYEISKEIYEKINLDGDYTGKKLVEKYPYVDDIKPVVNPYIESKENLIEGTKWFNTDGGENNIDCPLISNPSGVYAGSYLKGLSIGDEYSLKLDAELGYKFSVQQPDGSFTNSINLNDTHEYTFTALSGTLTLLMAAPNISQDSSATICDKFNLGLWKMSLVKGRMPKSYHDCHNSLIMFETKLYQGEKITRDNSGQYVKNIEYDEYPYDSILPYKLSTYTKPTDYKCISIKDMRLKNIKIGTSPMLVDYRGRLVKTLVNSNEYSHWCDVTNGIAYIMLPNTITGWGDNYTPTTDEIKAFFLGWKMYLHDNNGAQGNWLYNGSGTKAWGKLYCGIGEKSPVNHAVALSGVLTCPTYINNQGYTSYKLIYKKKTPTFEEVKVHGSLDVSKDSVVNVSSGLVIDELIWGFSHDKEGANYATATMPKHRYYNGLVKSISGESLYQYKVASSSGTSFIKRGAIDVYYGSDEEKVLFTYQIYKPDTVTSYDYVITNPKTLKETLNKTVEELSSSNNELAKTRRKLARLNYELSQRSNPNLLINGDFSQWQRGNVFDISNNSVKYTVDRWYHISDGSLSKIEKTHQGIKLSKTHTQVGGTYQFISQLLEQEISNRLRRKGNLTMSIKVLNGSCRISIGHAGYSGSVYSIVASPVISQGIHNITCDTSGFTRELLSVAIDINHLENGESVEIEWVKLELGEFATPFVPRSYGEELLSCQRYYQKMEYIGIGIQPDRGLIHYDKLMCTMRTIPTIKTYSVNGTLNKVTPWLSTVSGADMDIITTAKQDIVSFRAPVAAPTGTTGYNFSYEADAEIY